MCVITLCMVVINKNVLFQTDIRQKFQVYINLAMLVHHDFVNDTFELGIGHVLHRKNTF